MPGTLLQLKASMRRRLAPLARQMNLTARYRGNIDGYVGNELCGWVASSRTGAGGVRVGLFVEEGLLSTRVADDYRADVAGAGIGDGRSGFAFPIDKTVLAAAEPHGGRVYVRVLDATAQEIGSYDLPRADAGGLNDKGPHMEKCRQLLFGDLDLLGRLFAAAPRQPDPADRPPLDWRGKLFTTDPVLPEGAGPMLAPGIAPLPAYLDYTKFRMRKERDYDTEGNPDDRDHFLNWYLTVYSPARGGLRVPLTKALIDYLNDPLVTGGQRYSPTRMMWWRLAQNRELMKELDLSSDSFFQKLLYWWAWDEAPRLHVEDCLVTRRQADMLRTVHVSRKDDAFPMSVFMDHFHTNNSAVPFPQRRQGRGPPAADAVPDGDGGAPARGAALPAEPLAGAAARPARGPALDLRELRAGADPAPRHRRDRLRPLCRGDAAEGL